ncbi:MAG: adenylyltransferase/cytidyltransferase family protein [Planctomycetota bacterium]
MKAARGQVVAEAALLEALAARRAAGAKVVFTNGGFDLLHVGHVRMLTEAATLGDVLVVGVNDDASVRASKGPGRPLVPAAERAELIAAVAGVDYVVVFADRTVDRLLRAVRPDVHAKGRDYADATLPEAATNRALGITTAYVGDAKGHATSDLVARLGAPVVALDRVESVAVGGAAGLALRGKARFLAAHGLGDLPSLLAGTQGTVVLRHATRTVRRIEVSGEVVYAKVEPEARRGPGALDEFRHHLAVRAAGLRAPEPWLALEGKGPDGRKARALVTKEARGTPLDAFLRARLPAASARDRAAWARGLGVAVRALHTARFLHPDLLAHHLVVDGSPAGGPAALTFLDLARLDRARVRVSPKDAAPGLAALALSLRPFTTARFRLAVLRAYLGGSLSESRAWRDAIGKRIEKVKDRGTFRALAAEGGAS